MKGVVATSGDSIGHYRLLQTLGEGGMGVVRLGVDPDGRKVAIKVLRPAVAGDATARRRLAREVDSMRRVHSPHVAEILDADVTAEQPYIVTQYVPGRTLEEVVEDAGAPLHGPALQRLAVGLAAALSAIHGAGIIHRDLKPGNVMLVDTEPVVIDFGIAQGTDATRLTATGMVIGTPGYLAPEIIEGEDAGMPSDIHAWAATVAFAATARPPFGSGTFESIFYKIMQSKPDLDGMPDALLPLVRTAMARNPAERPTAVKLTQLARRINLDATITDQTMIDEPMRRRARSGQRPLDQAGQFYMPAAAETARRPPADRPTTADQPTTADRPTAADAALPTAADGVMPASAETPRPTAPQPQAAVPPAPSRPEPAPAQPRDFVGLLPPAAPPPAPAPYDPYGTYNQAVPRTQQPRRSRRDRSQGLPPPGPPAPYDQRGPYEQRPYDQQGPYGQQAPRGQSAQRRPESAQQQQKPPKPFGWYRLLSLMVLAALLGFAGSAPVLALIVTVGGVALLRVGDRAAKRMESKRTLRGPRSSDVVGAVLKAPLGVPRAVFVTALLVSLALSAGGVLLLVLMFARPELTAAWAIAYSVMAVILLLCVGPGSGAPRRQLVRTWGAFLPRREAAIPAALILGIFAGVLVMLSGTSDMPDTYPVNGMTKSLEQLRSDVNDLIGR